jgi:hypothetical protein
VKLCTVFAILISSVGTSAVAQEPRADVFCPGLTVTLRSEIDRMRKLQERAKKEEKAPPPDLLSAWQRTFGKKDAGVPSLRELQTVRRRADDLNASLRERGCATVDVDRALGVNAKGP